MLDSRPTWAGRTTVPAEKASAPASRSPPAARTWSPGLASCSTRTASSPSRRVRSTMTIASAPSGIGAPVMIRIASPGPTATVGAWPAGRSPTTRSRTGAPGAAADVSAARTAYPSIAVFANGGTDSEVTTSSASTRPSASRLGHSTGVSDSTAVSTSRCASAQRDQCHGVGQPSPRSRTMPREERTRVRTPRSGRSSASSMLARRKSTFLPMS